MNVVSVIDKITIPHQAFWTVDFFEHSYPSSPHPIIRLVSLVISFFSLISISPVQNQDRGDERFSNLLQIQ
jgi:hypothetical protein